MTCSDCTVGCAGCATGGGALLGGEIGSSALKTGEVDASRAICCVACKARVSVSSSSQSELSELAHGERAWGNSDGLGEEGDSVSPMLVSMVSFSTAGVVHASVGSPLSTHTTTRVF